MNSYNFSSAGSMWRVVFYERRANRVHIDRTGPWLPDKQLARNWALWFKDRGYHVALQDSAGTVERFSKGLPA